jgi:tetratricopeptide (TPR) repeat protein
MVRINVTLINALLDEHIWSESFERDVRDVMFLQNEVAQAIAQQVEVAIRPEEQDRFDLVRNIKPAAYEAYLKGAFHVERFTPQDMQMAAQYFQQAVKLDPDHALAYVGLAKLCTFQAQAGLIKPQQARERCLPPIMKALELDDTLPEAHFYHAAHLVWLQYEWEEGGAAFQRAIELNPSYAEARQFYSHYLTIRGRFEEGTEQMRLALELDPFNPFVQALHGTQLGMIGDLEGSIHVIEDVIASNPGFGFGRGALVFAYHCLGEKDKAIAQAAYVLRNLDRFPEGAETMEAAYSGGDYAAAMLAGAQALEERSKTTHVGPLAIGILYEYAGEIEKAIDWYEEGLRIRGPGVPYLGTNASLPEIESNPRYIKLLRDAGLDYWADKYEGRNESGSE